MTPEDQLERGLADLGLDLGPAIRAKLLAYLALLWKWNRVYNLTAIREPGRAVSHHLLDCLALLPQLGGATLADVGSGAGLPGIPLAIARPEWRVTLVESNRKKAAFLRQAAIELGLENVEIVEARAEDFRPPQGFEVVVARALSDLAEFIRIAGHLAARQGRLAAMKGLYPHQEIARLPAGWELEAVVKLPVPSVEGERHLVMLKRA
ncbi:MAG: 16S rRNA (guanine(527)-N(7))-methyltransferase RsmG [Betaproteobacteria bacterium]|nr:16S rRNA (guanine(527)-N(7))-methyltransferase RsmG [Betaproteobacteria bacterium]